MFRFSSCVPSTCTPSKERSSVDASMPDPELTQPHLPRESVEEGLRLTLQPHPPIHAQFGRGDMVPTSKIASVSKTDSSGPEEGRSDGFFSRGLSFFRTVDWNDKAEELWRNLTRPLIIPFISQPRLFVLNEEETRKGAKPDILYDWTTVLSLDDLDLRVHEKLKMLSTSPQPLPGAKVNEDDVRDTADEEKIDDPDMNDFSRPLRTLEMLEKEYKKGEKNRLSVPERARSRTEDNLKCPFPSRLHVHPQEFRVKSCSELSPVPTPFLSPPVSPEDLREEEFGLMMLKVDLGSSGESDEESCGQRREELQPRGEKGVEGGKRKSYSSVMGVPDVGSCSPVATFKRQDSDDRDYYGPEQGHIMDFSEGSVNHMEHEERMEEGSQTSGVTEVVPRVPFEDPSPLCRSQERREEEGPRLEGEERQEEESDGEEEEVVYGPLPRSVSFSSEVKSIPNLLELGEHENGKGSSSSSDPEKVEAESSEVRSENSSSRTGHLSARGVARGLLIGLYTKHS